MWIQQACSFFPYGSPSLSPPPPLPQISCSELGEEECDMLDFCARIDSYELVILSMSTDTINDSVL